MTSDGDHGAAGTTSGHGIRRARPAFSFAPAFAPALALAFACALAPGRGRAQDEAPPRSGSGDGGAAEQQALITALGRSLVDADLTVGNVVGVYRDGQASVRGYGHVARGRDTVPDGDTVYEIGSITKVFTGILLADAVERGVVALDDPLDEHLPDGAEAPSFGNERIRLVHLATHTSGLPRLPPDLRANAPDPYADYTARQLWAGLGRIPLRSAPGERYAYSNLASGLLGQTLAAAQDSTYAELVVERVCEPLGLHDTRTECTESMRARLAPPYAEDGRPRPSWHFDCLAGCGALRSTANDLLRFAAHNLAAARSDDRDLGLAPALRLAHRRRHDLGLGPGDGGIALGWHIEPDGRTLWHNGSTGGYRSFLAIDRERQVAVVVLANTTTRQLDSIGRGVLAVLTGRVAELPAARTVVSVDRAVLARHTGRFRLAAGATLTVELQENGLYARLSGQESHRIHALSDTRFFDRIDDAEVTFVAGADGSTEALVLHRNGVDQRAERIE